ncbi:hypothetical protein MSG28_015808 [Choristoneura fumiferana]|uniref:Uncharacterized protein n=1 Tax=Choristoneura fumiferana TaxID=7141 RepID=A0ACC0KBG0_CHOFU|nr:hypothetical protein MSG28_015808 [Choristoneura fumiferana]
MSHQNIRVSHTETSEQRGRKDVSDIFARSAVADINAGDCTTTSGARRSVRYNCDHNARAERAKRARLGSGRRSARRKNLIYLGNNLAPTSAGYVLNLRY